MIVIWIALGIVLAVLILSNLGLIISVAAILAAVVVLLGLGALTLDWIDYHPYEAIVLGVVVVVPLAYWIYVNWTERSASESQEIAERERSRRKGLGYDK